MGAHENKYIFVDDSHFNIYEGVKEIIEVIHAGKVKNKSSVYKKVYDIQTVQQLRDPESQVVITDVQID